jgi:hypothetical protein
MYQASVLLSLYYKSNTAAAREPFKFRFSVFTSRTTVVVTTNHQVNLRTQTGEQQRISNLWDVNMLNSSFIDGYLVTILRRKATGT